MKDISILCYTIYMKITKKHSRFTSKITIALILVVIITVIAAIFLSNLQDQNYFLEKNFEKISRNYYEETLYPQFIAEHEGESLEEAFDKYQTNGFTVHLRQILNYELLTNGSNLRSSFEGDDFSCDTNSSTAKFIPYAPFGKTDYAAEFNLDCTRD